MFYTNMGTLLAELQNVMMTSYIGLKVILTSANWISVRTSNWKAEEAKKVHIENKTKMKRNK